MYFGGGNQWLVKTTALGLHRANQLCEPQLQESVWCQFTESHSVYSVLLVILVGKMVYTARCLWGASRYRTRPDSLLRYLLFPSIEAAPHECWVAISTTSSKFTVLAAEIKENCQTMPLSITIQWGKGYEWCEQCLSPRYLTERLLFMKHVMAEIWHFLSKSILCWLYKGW